MRFFIKKLGCPKNDVDGDYIAGKLLADGHQLVDRENEAEAVIVNTCSFILPAKEESIAEILRYENLKKEKKIGRLYVTGCLSQRYGEHLLNDIRGIDGVFGLGQIEALARAVALHRPERTSAIQPALNLDYLSGERRYVDHSYPFEYLKISEGCDRFCSYCAIPLIRGKYRSRPPGEIVKEARLLAEEGKKEIILVSQEGTGYGRDLDDGVDIINLLTALQDIDKIEWIRLMYLHPEAVNDRLIDFMADSPRVLSYFDLPLQHINDRILKAMNRRIDRGRIEEILNRIRSANRNSTIRTSFIVGLPGETDEEFAELCDFVDEFEFDRLGVFKYSLEENTPAANFGNQVPETTKEERMDALMALQQEIAYQKNIDLIGSVQKVIIDKTDDGGVAIGRTPGDCPEIDQNVILKNQEVRVGDILEVKIIMADGYDLIAEIPEERP
ncbi:Ribosomal protein S12 methylthiotransferase RimO [Candidatus Zixiibacteriota bacterium]|nr:Ribosomal protein S12 methylthiotransferase RimO [candidate division Zixibacteria bacterium]